MTKSEKNPKVEFFFNKETAWHTEIAKLRDIALGTGLTEDLKWGCPCYTLGKSNIVLIHVFKEYCALLFFKGAILPDPQGLLIQQTEHVQAARQMRFTSVKEVTTRKAAIKACIEEAIKADKAGLKVTLKKAPEPIPGEFQQRLTKDAHLRKAFEALTPGRRRAYILHFSAPKQSRTRESRIDKCIPLILDGKGLNDE